MPRELDINAWMTRSTIQFEMFLEEKLELLEEAAELANMMSAATSGGGASKSAVDGEEGSGQQASPVFQLSEGLRVLPATFIDDSHRFVETLYINLPTGFGGDCGGARNTRGAISQDVFNNGEAGDDVIADDDDEDSKHMPFLYGEASSIGVRQIYNHLIGGDADTTNSTRSGGGGGGISFVDLGSGVGKLVVEMAHYHHATNPLSHHQTPATFMGIELDRERAVVGDMALKTESFISEFTSSSSEPPTTMMSPTPPRVELLEGDMFHLLPSIATRSENLEEGASHFLFCCGVGFSNAFVGKLCSLIYDTYSPQIQGSALKGCILLFKQHPRGHPLYTHASTQEMITIGTSWMDEAPAVLLKFKPRRMF